MNASFDGRPVRVQLESEHLVLIDPLALDGLSTQLAEVGKAPSDRAALPAEGSWRATVCANSLAAPTPGIYEIGLDSFEAAVESDVDAGVFDTESGTVIVIDGSALSAVALALTWDRFDRLLQAQAGDDSILLEINQAVGGPRFAIVSADAESPFSGDGAFRLRPEGLMLIR
jgi:hypothetical protein